MSLTTAATKSGICSRLAATSRPATTARLATSSHYSSPASVRLFSSAPSPSALQHPRQLRLDSPLRRLSHHTSNNRRDFSSSSIMSKGVHNVTTKAEWDAVLKQDSSLVVLDAFATWCGPCKVIAPQVVKFSEQFPQARFYKIDVDELPDVAQELSIRAMPTFLLFKDGEKVGEIVGANPKALLAAIEQGV